MHLATSILTFICMPLHVEEDLRGSEESSPNLAAGSGVLESILGHGEVTDFD
jgi:hypothetical protein